MLAGIFHEGSGLGNQLHRYVAVRCLALDKGLDWAMQYPENFKGLSLFLNMEFGLPVENIKYKFQEERVNHPSGADIRPYDEKFKEIEDNTLIDGEFQDEKYFMHHIDEVREWLEPIGKSPFQSYEKWNNTCVINFRGGEYVGVHDLFLPQEYWLHAMAEMKKKYPFVYFEVHTDDPETAKKFFPSLPIYSGMELNWRAIRYANYLILSNSSFAILPALLNENAKMIIAPKYWAGRNVGYWKMRQNEYSKFTYL